MVSTKSGEHDRFTVLQPFVFLRHNKKQEGHEGPNIARLIINIPHDYAGTNNIVKYK
jgi:hypothetical protein